jgi:hypothetical protein
MTETSTTVRPPAAPARPRRVARVDGVAVITRQYDVGYEIVLDRALESLSHGSATRAAPTRAEAQAIRIPNPPITVSLGSEEIVIDGMRVPAAVSALVFDFAVISLRAEIGLPRDLPWERFAALGSQVDLARELGPVFERHLGALLGRIATAVVRPETFAETEDYVVFRVEALRDAAGDPLPPTALADEDIAPLLLGESRALSEAAHRELLAARFSYYAADLAVVTWNNALVVEAPDDRDVQYVLEFANAQLLELRVYDRLLDLELPKLYSRIGAVRRQRLLVGHRYGSLLRELQQVMADVIETVERAENALKVTDDVYLARIYAAALEIFRGRAWRAGIDRKLAILRDTYAMLNAESQTGRAELLEIAIVVLIVTEIVLSLVRR